MGTRFGHRTERGMIEMGYSFDIYITGISPAEAISLFNEQVKEGKDRYEISKTKMRYVLYSGFADQHETDIIFEMTGMNLEVYASCHRSLGSDLNVSTMKTTLIDNALHKTDRDFVVLSGFETIIAMRKNGEVIVNSAITERWRGIDLSIFDMPHQIRELPQF